MSATSTGKDSLVFVSLNTKFATHLGLRNHENVLISSVKGLMPLERVLLEPMVEDDWEILECKALKVEMDLLSQLRVVQLGVPYVIFVSNISISIKITKLCHENRTMVFFNNTLSYM